jgi:preprotein translocase subunit SecD
MTVRRLGAVLAVGLPLAALVACGDEEPRTEPDASGAAVELRVVLATSEAPPPDSLVKQQLDALDCEAPPAGAAPEEPLAACDDDGVEYVLEPAAVVGGVESATASIPEGQVAWVVSVDLDAPSTRAFAALSRELAGTPGRFAVVVDGRVLTAPTVDTPVTDGRLQLSGDYTEESATALADRLD